MYRDTLLSDKPNLDVVCNVSRDDVLRPCTTEMLGGIVGLCNQLLHDNKPSSLVFHLPIRVKTRHEQKLRDLAWIDVA